MEPGGGRNGSLGEKSHNAYILFNYPIGCKCGLKFTVWNLTVQWLGCRVIVYSCVQGAIGLQFRNQIGNYGLRGGFGVLGLNGLRVTVEDSILGGSVPIGWAPKTLKFLYSPSLDQAKSADPQSLISTP